MIDKTKNIEDILKNHGKRKQPDDLMKKRAMKNVHAHWQANIQRQQSQKKTTQTFVFKIAASLLFVIGATVLYNFSGFNNTTAIFSTQQLAQGEIFYSTDGNNWIKSNQKYIEQGSWLKTSTDSYSTITLADNSQLRINQNTLIEFVSLDEVRVINGGLYHDSYNTTKTMPLTIKTSLGNIQHIGTRYLVNKNDTELQVSVRNGLVKIDSDKLKRQIQSGKQLTVDSNGNQIETSVSSYDPLWTWTQLAGQPFNAKDKSLNDFITWYAHENGYEVDWNNQQSKTKRVKVTGNIARLNSTQQIKSIFLATKFDYEINRGILTIL